MNPLVLLAVNTMDLAKMFAVGLQRPRITALCGVNRGRRPQACVRGTGAEDQSGLLRVA
ncbi:MAG: hypothetical protein RLZZ624_68 [Cyanobacteriota bacterium]|jgi:hypothetical protein